MPYPASVTVVRATKPRWALDVMPDHVIRGIGSPVDSSLMVTHASRRDIELPFLDGPTFPVVDNRLGPLARISVGDTPISQGNPEFVNAQKSEGWGGTQVQPLHFSRTVW